MACRARGASGAGRLQVGGGQAGLGGGVDGQDHEAQSVAQGAPAEHIDDVEPVWRKKKRSGNELRRAITVEHGHGREGTGDTAGRKDSSRTGRGTAVYCTIGSWWQQI